MPLVGMGAFETKLSGDWCGITESTFERIKSFRITRLPAFTKGANLLITLWCFAAGVLLEGWALRSIRTLLLLE